LCFENLVLKSFQKIAVIAASAKRYKKLALLDKVYVRCQDMLQSLLLNRLLWCVAVFKKPLGKA
jgi:hypothetical protein